MIGSECPVPLEQDESEFANLLRLVEERGAHRVLEIGSKYGGGVWHWLQRSVPGDTIVTVDWSEGFGAIPGISEYHDRWSGWVPSGVYFRAFDADSQAEDTRDMIMELCPEFDCVFIDADHRYEAVKRDFELYWPLVADDGFLALHDVNAVPVPDTRDVVRFWQEVQAMGYRTTTFIAGGYNETPGIGVIFKMRK